MWCGIGRWGDVREMPIKYWWDDKTIECWGVMKNIDTISFTIFLTMSKHVDVFRHLFVDLNNTYRSLNLFIALHHSLNIIGNFNGYVT